MLPDDIVAPVFLGVLAFMICGCDRHSAKVIVNGQHFINLGICMEQGSACFDLVLDHLLDLISCHLNTFHLVAPLPVCEHSIILSSNQHKSGHTTCGMPCVDGTYSMLYNDPPDLLTPTQARGLAAGW